MFNFLNGTKNELSILGKVVSDIKVSEVGKEKKFCKAEFRMSENLAKGKDAEPIWQSYFVSCIGRDAEMVRDYVAKGRQVLVKGSLQVKFALNKEGKPDGFLNVDCTSIIAGPSGDAQQGGGKPAASKKPADDDSDDLPF
jgi:single-stranded DNA-binding protein